MKKSLLWVAMIAIAVSAQAPASPVDIIKKKDTELQQLLVKNRKAPSKANTDKIKFLINDIFDFQEMGQKALPAETWNKADAPKRKEFVDSFRKMVENSSVKKLEVYESDSTLYQPPKIEGDKAEVTATVFLKGKKSVLVYKLKNNKDQWKAWDLVIDDLSTVRNYREQFAKTLKKGDLNALIKKLKDKSAK